MASTAAKRAARRERSAEDLPSVRDVSREEGLAIIDRQARRYLGISGAEFLRRWHTGEYAGREEDPGVMDVIMLLPFAS